MITTPAKTATTAQAWRDRVEAADWGAVGAELGAYGCALTGPPLTPPEATLIAALYPDDSQFRSTVNMARLRFGEGEYRYFAKPFPDAVVALKPALYPLPIARECWTRLGRDTAWPDSLDDWLDVCHTAGQTKSTPILLRYGEGDWNALHRDLYGELVFPLQVVINLSDPAATTRRRVPALRAASAGTVPRHGHPHPARPGPRVHHPRPPGDLQAGLVDCARAARRIRDPLRASFSLGLVFHDAA